MGTIKEYFCSACGATILNANVKRSPGGVQYCPLCGGMQLIPIVDDNTAKTLGLQGDPNRAIPYGKKKKRDVYPVAEDAFSFRVGQANTQYQWKMHDRGDDETPLATIKEAREYIRNEFGVGESCRCPACGQLANLHSRKLNRTMVSFLGRLARMVRDPSYPKVAEYVEVRTILGLHGNNLTSATSQGASLRMWGLLHVPLVSPGEQSKGLYKMSPLGEEFLKGAFTVPKYLYVYDNVLFGVSPDKINVHQAYAEEFNYDEVLQTLSLDNVLPYHIGKKKGGA